MEIFDYIIKSFLGACGAGGLTLLIITIKWLWKKVRVDDLTIEALATDAYFRHCKQLLNRDEIYDDELERHNLLYKAYVAQGLNGTGKRMHELIDEKKVVSRT